MGEANSIVSSGYIVVLVEEPEVDWVPDGAESQTDDGKQNTSPKEGSGWGLIFVEEDNHKSKGDNDGNVQENANENVPPVNVVIEKLVEDLEELGKSGQ